MAKKWEYMVIDSEIDEKFLNRLGDQGWELVAYPAMGTVDTTSKVTVLKREKP